jgi:hypothetical protein
MYQTTQQKIAVSGVMAAFMAVAGFFPAVPLFGMGKVITLGAIIIPIIGILLGPVIGGYAALVGALIGQTIAPYGAVFGFLTFIPPTLGAVAAGLLAHKKWQHAALLLGSLILLWYATDVGAQLWYFPYLHILAVLVILVWGRRISLARGNLFFSVFLIAFCAILTDHMAGNLVFFVTASPTKAAFSAVLVQYSFERILMAVFSTVIGAGALRILKEVNIWKPEK